MLTTGQTTAAFGGDLSSEPIWRRRLRSECEQTIWRLKVKTPPIAWRLFEILFSALLAIVLLPVLIPLYGAAKLKGGGIRRTLRIGQDGKEFEEFSLCFDPYLSAKNRLLALFGRMPALANILRANMSLVGPRTVSREEISFQDRSVWRRFGSRPGVVGLWWVRKQANIAYEPEAVVDAEYIESKTMAKDLGILLRSVPAAFYGSRRCCPARRIQILDVAIDNVGMEEAIAEVIAAFSRPAPTQVCFVNVDCVNIAQRDPDYAQLLKECPLVLADGIGLKLAGNLLGAPIRQNVNGTDLLPRLCAKLAAGERGIYLLGGAAGVADEVAAWMRTTFPGLRVRGTRDGYFSAEEIPAVSETIRASGADVLLVALGAPKQDKWIREHLLSTGVKVAIGVGGLFDFYSGRMERAPIWIREIGMEWLFRLAKEPRRMWKRYVLGNAVFAWRILCRRAAGRVT